MISGKGSYRLYIGKTLPPQTLELEDPEPEPDPEPAKSKHNLERIDKMGE